MGCQGRGEIWGKECCQVGSQSMGCQGGGKNFIKGMLYLNLNHWKHGLPRGGEIWEKECCQVGSQSMSCQGGGEIFYKRNVVLELESLKAWVAKGGGKGGENLIKGMLSWTWIIESMGCQGGGGEIWEKECCQVGSQSMGCQGGGKIFIKGMLYLNLNHWKHGLPRGGGKFDKRNVVR